jgi:putative acetyltransferase
MITEVPQAERTAPLIASLLAVWEDSVRATHDFLTEADIQSITPTVQSALAAIPSLTVVYAADDAPLGFMGVDGDKIEMLFISPHSRGMGLGKAFIAYALDVLKAQYVDVNEQNAQGVGFYTHVGFRAFDRSERDGQGKPFPILHMKIEAR